MTIKESELLYILGEEEPEDLEQYKQQEATESAGSATITSAATARGTLYA
jgi:hypothetical protein